MQSTRFSMFALLVAALAAAISAPRAEAQSSPSRRVRIPSGAMVRPSARRAAVSDLDELDAVDEEFEEIESARATSARPASTRSNRASRARAVGQPVELEGVLRRNTGARRGESPWWLTQNGVPKYYVAPTQGLDLEEYEGRRVVLQGNRQKMPGESVPRLIAVDAELKAQRIVRQRREADGMLEDEEIALAAAEEEAPTLRSEGTRKVGSALKRQPAPEATPPAPVEGADMEPAPRTATRARRNTTVIDESAHGGYVDSEWQDDGFACGTGCMDGCDGGDCCGCNMGCLPGDYGYGLRGGLYMRFEYLHWWTKGMNTPPLVTTSTDTALNNNIGTVTGAIGSPNTSVLYGGNRIFDSSRGGGRVTMGLWLDPCHQWAAEGEYFSLGQRSERFQASSNGLAGALLIARPFVRVGGTDANGDALDTGEVAEEVSGLGRFRGGIDIRSTNRFQGAGAWLNRTMACGCDCDRQYQLGFIGGWRFLRLDDDIRIQENPTALIQIGDTPANTAFVLVDFFQTKNVFNGFVFGPTFHTRWREWSLQGAMKLSLGGVRSTATIDGSTTINGAAQNFRGGLLTQTTNIGVRERDDFTAISELNLILGYQFNPVWRANVGLNFIYWPKVYRAGDLISRDVNTDFLAPRNAVVPGLQRPEFRWVADDFWAYGLSTGVEARF